MSDPFSKTIVINNSENIHHVLNKKVMMVDAYEDQKYIMHMKNVIIKILSKKNDEITLLVKHIL
jgi:hypothetical protein